MQPISTHAVLRSSRRGHGLLAFVFAYFRGPPLARSVRRTAVPGHLPHSTAASSFPLGSLTTFDDASQASCSTHWPKARPSRVRGGQNIQHSSSSETAGYANVVLAKNLISVADGYGLPEAEFPQTQAVDPRILARRLAHDPNPPNAEDLRGLRSADPERRQPGRVSAVGQSGSRLGLQVATGTWRGEGLRCWPFGGMGHGVRLSSVATARARRGKPGVVVQH
jgi:hypothetical protein